MILRFIPVITVMATIFLLSHTPGDDLPSQLAGLDKLCHAIAYGALATTAIFAILPWSHKRRQVMALAVWLFCLLHGLSDEFHQSFIAGRYPSGADIIADGIGAGIIVGGWLLVTMKYSKNKNRNLKLET